MPKPTDKPLVRFVFLDYWDVSNQLRAVTILISVPGQEWATLEGSTQPMPLSGVLAHPIPKDVKGRMESRRLSLADSELVGDDGESYWERAAAQP